MVGSNFFNKIMLLEPKQKIQEFFKLMAMVVVVFYIERSLEFLYIYGQISYLTISGKSVSAFTESGKNLWHLTLPDSIKEVCVATEPTTHERYAFIATKKSTDDPALAVSDTYSTKVIACTTSTNWLRNIFYHLTAEKVWERTYTGAHYNIQNPHYLIGQMLAFSQSVKGKPCLAVQYIDQWQFPQVLVLYDMRNGDTLAHYLHPGHAGYMHLAFFQDDPKEYILMHTPNNALRVKPEVFQKDTIFSNQYPESLCLIDPERLSGTAPPPIEDKDTPGFDSVAAVRSFSALWYGVFPAKSDANYRILRIEFMQGPFHDIVPPNITAIRCELTNGTSYLINKEGKTLGVEYTDQDIRNKNFPVKADTLRIISREGKYYENFSVQCHNERLTMR